MFHPQVQKFSSPDFWIWLTSVQKKQKENQWRVKHNQKEEHNQKEGRVSELFFRVSKVIFQRKKEFSPYFAALHVHVFLFSGTPSKWLIWRSRRAENVAILGNHPYYACAHAIFFILRRRRHLRRPLRKVPIIFWSSKSFYCLSFFLYYGFT